MKIEGMLIDALPRESNSTIFLKNSRRFPDSTQPYSVQKIYKDDAGDVAFHLKKYKPTSRNAPDPYSKYPVFRGKIWSQQLDDYIVIVKPSEIRCHGAVWKFCRTDSVVVMLDRVSHAVLL